MKKAEAKVYKERLLLMRARLRGDVNAMAEAALSKTRTEASGDLSSMPIHMADVGSDNYEQEFTLSLMQNEEETLEMIEGALERIEDGVMVRASSAMVGSRKRDSMPSRTPLSASNAPASLKAADSNDRIQIPRHRYVVFFAIAVIGCAIDLGTKQAVFAWRGPPTPTGHNEWWLIEPYVGIETAVNIGALFGFGPGAGRYFALLSIVAAVGILVWLFHFGAAKDGWLTVALGCVMAGIFGNLYDRMGFWYQTGMPVQWKSGVRDWILFRYGDHTWPNFNIADSLLVCGAAMLMWQAIMDSTSKRVDAPAQAANK